MAAVWENEGSCNFWQVRKNGTLYIAVTSDLVRRIHEHQQGFVDGFTKKYKVKTLVYFEVFDDMEHAIAREKAMKKWNREWKIRHIEKDNPDWRDLYQTITGFPPTRE